MALITTTASLLRQYNAFTGLSAIERSQSGIARAEVVYYNVNDSWPAAGAGNNREYTSGIVDLPKDFGYVLTDCFVRVEADSDDVIPTEMVGAFRIYPGGILGPQINTYLKAEPSKMDNLGSTQVGSIVAGRYNTNYPSFGDHGAINYALEVKPTALIYPFASQTYTTTPNPASSFQFQIGEQSLGDIRAYDVSVYLRFLQYDVDQSYNYVIQSPQLTR